MANLARSKDKSEFSLNLWPSTKLLLHRQKKIGWGELFESIIVISILGRINDEIILTQGYLRMVFFSAAVF